MPILLLWITVNFVGSDPMKQNTVTESPLRVLHVARL